MNASIHKYQSMKFNFNDTLKPWLPFSVDTKKRDALFVKSFNFHISDKFSLFCQLALQLLSLFILGVHFLLYNALNHNKLWHIIHVQP